MTEKPLCTRCLHKCKVCSYFKCAYLKVFRSAKAEKVNALAAELDMKSKVKSTKRTELTIARNLLRRLLQSQKKTTISL